MATLTGTSGNDTLIGTSGADTITGAAGNDSLFGGAGADTLIGDAGNDTLNGGVVTDNFLGTDWNFTTYISATGGVNINLAGVTGDGSTGSGTATGDASVGTDTLIAINLIQGSAFNDTIIGSTALVFEQFEGGAGNDYLDGGVITDLTNGENGNRVTYHNATGAGVTVDLIAGTAVGAAGSNIGNDTLVNFSQVRGSNFADTLLGTNRTDFTEQFEGRAGDDYIDGRGGFDIARYGSATTQVIVNLVTGLATGAMGNDTLVGIEGVRGGSAGDILTGGNALNGVVYNDGLSEVFRGEAGNDTIDGGQGYDRADYDSSTAAVVVTLNDTLDDTASDGLGGTDVLRNIEAVRGSNFGDVLTGSNTAVFESFEGLGGNDTINGMGGIDRVDYQNARAAVTVNLSTGVASDGYGGTDTLSNIENVRGSRDFNDTITGSSGNNFLQGQGGDDWFYGSAGSDTLDGGTGYDRANYRNLTTAVTINLAAGTAVKTGGGTDMLFGIERVMGSAFADSITGSAADDDFSGNGGNDTMDGGAGFDFVWYGNAISSINANLATGLVTGGEGTDTLISIEAIAGSNFADTIVGSAGDDYIRGDVDIFGTAPSGSTGDSLNGGAGFDVLDYRDDPGAVSVNLQTQRATDGRGGVDTVEGFEEARGSAFNDVLTGSTNLYFERFEGRAGDDTIDGGLITDTLNQTNSNQASYRFAGAAVLVNLADGNASGGAGNDVLLNINQVRGSAFNDTLIGSNRSDVTEQFEGREGNDSIDGAGGFDIVRYSSATTQVVVNLATGLATGAMGSDTLTGIEGAFGGSGDDILTGGNALNGVVYNDGLAEVFRGEAGNDTIDGGQGYDRADYTNSTSGVVVTLNDSLDGSASDGLGGTDVLRNIEAIRGSAFGDVLTGSNTAIFESFEGREGNDTINGNGGTDRADYRDSTSGIVVNLTTGTASDGYGGTDSLSNIENVRGSRDFNDSITGSTANNYLEGLGGNDTLSGADGDDTLIGGAGDDSLVGGAGIDTASYADATGAIVATLSGAGSATGADGTDVLSSIENLIGSSYADSLTGSTAANRLEGGAGNDTLNGGSGADTLLGGAGDDQYSVDNIADVVTENAAQGTDTVLSSVSFVLGANVENLRLTAATAINGTGNNLNNLIIAGAGDNILDGSTGIDTASYAYSSAAVTASLTGRTATGGSGNDSILNFENIIGSNYNDSLTGNTLANQLEGAGGADILNGGAGADTMTGGSGSDTFYVDNTGDIVIETGSDALSGTDTVYASISYSLTANVENLRINSSTNINATGNELNNTLFAGAGNNILNGAGGIDTASYANTSGGVNVSLATESAQATGNSGTDTLISIENLTGSNYNDTLQGSNADNTIDGGVGTDTMSYANAAAAVTASLASKSATGGGGNDTLLRLENLIGSDYNDSLTGSSGANELTGGKGNDSLNGSSGNDTLSGGDGNDLMLGGAGQDQLTGGAGADTFDFNSLAEMGLTSANWDRITDFNGAEGDRIDLYSLDANTAAAGNQDFSFIGSASFTAAGQLRYDAAAGVLYGNVDADATAEFAIQLVGNPAFIADYLIA